VLPGDLALLGAVAYLRAQRLPGRRSHSPWDRLAGWSLGGIERHDRLHLTMNGRPADAVVTWEAGECQHVLVRSEGHTIEGRVGALRVTRQSIEAEIDGRPVTAAIHLDRGDGRVWLGSGLGHVEVSGIDLLDRDEGAGAGGATVRAPMPGKVVRLFTEVGAQVKRGDRLVVLEAMKMEHALAAGFDGQVLRLGAKEGEQVEEGRVLVELAPVEESAIG
jgi:3-methylcrotonyl-CoA carboxylase alpha subunit